MSWTPPEVVASYPKISPEEQVRRDALANDLRRQYEPDAPTVQEEQRIFRQADAAKGNIPPEVKAKLHVTTGMDKPDEPWVPPEVKKGGWVPLEVKQTPEYWGKDSPLDKALNDLEGPIGSPVKKTLDALEKHVREGMDAIDSNPGASAAGLGFGITGGIAQFLGSSGDALLKVIQAFQLGVPMKDMLKEHEHWNEDYSKKWKQAVVNVASILGEEAGKATIGVVSSPEYDKAQSILGAPFAPVEGVAGAFEETGNPNAAAGTTLIGEAALGGLFARGVLKGRSAEKPVETRDVPPLPPEEVASKMPENTIPWEKVPVPEELKTELGAAPEKKGPVGNEIPYDPTVEKIYGEAATELSARSAGVDRPLDMQLDLFDKPDPVREIETKLEFDRQQEIQRSFEAAQLELGFGKEGIIEDAIKSNVKEGFTRDAVDLLNIREGERVAPQLLGKSQRGHGDMFNDLGKAVYDAGKAVVDAFKGPKYLLGDRVMLQSGKEGIITAKTESGYQIKLKQGGYDFVPETGIMFKSTVSGVGKAGYKQQGHGEMFNFGREEKKETGIEKTTELLSIPDETTGEFISKYKKPETDIKKRLGMSTQSFRSLNPYLRNLGDMAYRVVHHFENKLLEASMTQHRLTFIDKAIVNKFQGHYGLGKISKPFDVRGFKQDIALVLDWERNPTWFNNKDYYPSVQQMLDMGMRPESVPVWKSMFDAFERNWNTIEAAAHMAGRHMPKRIPGYVPHVWKGPYAVLVERVSNGLVVKNVQEFNYSSMKDAVNVMKALEASHGHDPTLQIRIEKPNPDGTGINEILDGLWRAADRLESAKGLEALVEGLYKSAAKGIVSGALERSNPLKGGHLLERANLKGDFGLSHNLIDSYLPTQSGMKDAVKLFGQTIEAVNDWYARTKFVTETLFPLDQAGFLDQPMLRDAARTYMENFFHIPKTKLRDLDVFIKDGLVRGGFDPALAGRVASFMNSGLARYYLVANVSFYAANALQFSIILPSLFAMKAVGELRGERTGSISKALAKGTWESANLLRLDEKNPNVKWAKDHGFIDPSGIEHLDPGKMKDPIAMGIERRTRMMAFNFGLEYFKQIMPERQALIAAGKFANHVSVPYAKELGAPSLLAQLPVVGTSMVMFMTYQQHMLGMLNQQRILALEGTKAANPKAVMNAATSAALTQSLNMALFGLGAVAFANNWDGFARMWNKFMGDDLYTTKELGRMIDKTLDTGGVATHGTVSAILGYDISASGSGPGIAPPLAGVEGLSSIVEGLILGGKWMAKEVPPSKKEVWEWARTLPKQYQGPLEFAIKKPDLFEDVLKYGKDAFEGKDTTAEKDINMPGIPRTDWQAFWRMITGLKSTDETSYNATAQITTMQEMRMKDKVDKILQHLKEHPVIGDRERQLVMQLGVEAGKDPGYVVDAIINYRMQMKMTPDQRKASKASSLEGIGKYQRYQEQRSLE